MATIVFEQFTSGKATPEALWAVVGSPLRLAEWTDADNVIDACPDPPAAGHTFVTIDADRKLEWTVHSYEQYLFEVVTVIPAGRLGIGARVFPQTSGARLVLAGAFRPASASARTKFVVLGKSALRRRFDRWASTALRLAQRCPPD